MRKLSVYNFISLNGFYKGINEDISWHKHGREEAEFSSENLKQNNILLFGRVTYEMMAGFWPSAMAFENFPDVAKEMNDAEKIVFSKTMKKPQWKNTKALNENIAEQIKSMKQLPGKDMTLLGSGSILSQFADQGIIDEYQFMIDPVVLHKGIPVFNNIKSKLILELTNSKIFKSGSVLLIYAPVKI